MMNALSNLTAPGRTAALVALMVAASAALSLGFACALPLAAFATMAAMALAPAAAVGAILAVWLVNQAIGFAFLGYPADPSSFAWGAALGAIALLSLGAATLVLARLRGVAGASLAFVAAFVVYEGAVYAGCLVSDCGVSDFTPANVARIALINAAAFGALLAIRAAALRVAPSASASALRHA
jgi:hypothetical protein